jgi:glycine/D-amino acid oxidase-like deaminating enzyme
MLGREELRAMVPGLGDRVVGASYCPIDGEAHSLYLLRALHAALLHLGGEYLPGRTVDAIDAAPNSFTVRVGTERFTAAKLVIAAGLGSRELAPMVGLSMPVVPSRGQIIVTERLRPFLDYTCHTLRQTVEGTVMLGDSQEDAGFDTSIGVPVLQDIATRNLAVFPALKDATVVRMWAALRVMSPDGFPIYEQSQRYPGAFAATCHSGVTLAGAHALALAPSILAGELPERFAAFDSQRFDVPAA